MSVAIHSQPLQLTQVYAACNVCGSSLVREGKALLHEGEVRFPHTCKRCNTVYLLSESFPVVKAASDLLTQYQQVADTAIIKPKEKE